MTKLRNLSTYLVEYQFTIRHRIEEGLRDDYRQHFDRDECGRTLFSMSKNEYKNKPKKCTFQREK